MGERERGSVLVDALVAIGVMTVTLALAAQVVGEGARRTGAVERSRLAALEARSRLAEVGGDIALAPGRSSGTDDDLVWTVDIAPRPAAAAARSGPLLDISVTVGGPDGPPLATLRSVRVAG